LDVKPENILFLSEDPSSALLADFGLAKHAPNGVSGSKGRGSLHYCAPEVYNKELITAKADIWSVGVTM
jgi:serine/threonine protein kinase